MSAVPLLVSILNHQSVYRVTCDYLLIALDGQQHLSVIIMTIGLEREFLVNGSRLPITPGSTLTWIGSVTSSHSQLI